jgi:hypothetical protein
VNAATERDQQKTDYRSEQRMFDEDCHRPEDQIHHKSPFTLNQSD